MNTRTKIMGLAALPLAGLLATGGAAVAQAAGTPGREGAGLSHVRRWGHSPTRDARPGPPTRPPHWRRG